MEKLLPMACSSYAIDATRIPTLLQGASPKERFVIRPAELWPGLSPRTRWGQLDKPPPPPIELTTKV